MPRGDRTGPAGAGSMTGQGWGYCAGYNMPGHMSPGFRPRMSIGWGRGWGRGFGYRNRPFCGWAHPFWFQPQSPKDRKEALSEYKRQLEEEIKEVSQALEDVKKG
jgi:hypothetical protein